MIHKYGTFVNLDTSTVHLYITFGLPEYMYGAREYIITTYYMAWYP